MGYHPDDYAKTPHWREYNIKQSDAESTKMLIESNLPTLDDIEEEIETLKDIDGRNPRAQFELDCLEAILEAERGDE